MIVKKTLYPTRYFIGIEHDHPLPKDHKEDSHVGPLFRRLEAWEEDIEHIKIPKQYLGLACFPPQVLDLDTFDYFALLEVEKLSEVSTPLVQKKLPKGLYLEAKTTFESLRSTIEEMYQYIKEHDINIHEGFDALQFEETTEDIVFSVMVKNEDE